MSVSWVIEERQGTTLVRMSGRITEEASFDEIVAMSEGGGIVIDLAGVDQINSCGVREWILFMRQLAASGAPLSLEQCSPAIVRQLNMISNFAGEAQIRSVRLPYCCEGCNSEDNVPITLGEVSAEIQEVRKCTHCGGEAEFDDLPDSYLTFADLVS